MRAAVFLPERKVFSNPHSAFCYLWLGTGLSPLPVPPNSPGQPATVPRGRVGRREGPTAPGICPSGPWGGSVRLGPAGFSSWTRRDALDRGSAAVRTLLEETAAGHSRSRRTSGPAQGREAGGALGQVLQRPPLPAASRPPRVPQSPSLTRHLHKFRNVFISWCGLISFLLIRKEDRKKVTRLADFNAY